jgi:diguanylate cyclase (GGDEF)-like protein
MKIRFWGTRGSIAAPGPHTAKFGGNTSCVEVRSDDGTIIVLDCGTGARELGQHLVDTTSTPIGVNLLIGHTHWDHIQGFPFFQPAFAAETELNIYAPRGFQHNLEDSLAGQMQYSYFPVRLRELRSRIHFTELEEGFFRVGDILVETQHLNHTAPTIAYRITCDGASMAYVTDHEPYWKPNGREFRHPGDQRHVAFLKGVDFVIHDAQYTEAEYADKFGWGHSSIEYATDVAIAAGVQRLALFHHDPERPDGELERLENGAQQRAAAAGSRLDVFAAAEGMTIEVRGHDAAPHMLELSALHHHPIAGSQVLLVSPNDADIAAITHELEEDNLVLTRVTGAQSALVRSMQTSPDLVIINDELSDGTGVELIHPLRSRLGRDKLPVVLLTSGVDTQHRLEGVQAAVTDYLAKPFSPPMLRSRVRAWLARGSAEAPLARAPGAHIVIPPVTKADMVEMLATLPMFSVLTHEQLAALAEGAEEQVYDAGETIIQQGQPSDYLSVVLDGKARVVHASEDASPFELMLGELGRGEVFGELGILSDRPRSATVVAVEPVRCITLQRDAFQDVLDSAPAFSRALLQLISLRLYDADRRLARYAPDPLTGLASRRTFLDLYPRMAAQAQRQRNGLRLIVLDLVHLKAINDRFGYTVGDEILRTLADALMESARRTDLVARYGGDEFAILLSGSAPRTENILTKRLQQKLADLAARRNLPLDIECTVGVAQSQLPPEPAEELFRRADHDMLRRRTRIKVRNGSPARKAPSASGKGVGSEPEASRRQTYAGADVVHSSRVPKGSN